MMIPLQQLPMEVWGLALVGLLTVLAALALRLPRLAPGGRGKAITRLTSLSQYAQLEVLYSDLKHSKLALGETRTQGVLRAGEKLILTEQFDLFAITSILHQQAQLQQREESSIVIIHLVLVLTNNNSKGYLDRAKIKYLQTLAHGINAEQRGIRIILRKTDSLPGILPQPLSVIHLAFILLSLLIFLTFSSFSQMDPNTLRPNADFNPVLKQIAKWTNLPIKLGLVHFTLYASEFAFLILADDDSLFATHVGQRMTTLWYQFLQPVRFGQHLQMHLETLMQVADCFFHNGGHPRLLRMFWALIVCGVLVQNALTSLAYHSMEEQAWGFALFLVKYLYFDLSARGTWINQILGRMVAGSKRQFGGGIAMLLLGLALNQFKAFHPTAMASCLFLGGAIVSWWFITEETREDV